MVQVNIGKSIEMDVDFASMPQAAIDHILYIGARNVLMDSHASITAATNPNDLQDAATAMAQKKLNALMRGEVRVQSTREGDPVRAEAKGMARSILAGKLRQAGKKMKDFTPEAINAAIAKLITPELIEKARARIEENKLVDVESLADLGL